MESCPFDNSSLCIYIFFFFGQKPVDSTSSSSFWLPVSPNSIVCFELFPVLSEEMAAASAKLERIVEPPSQSRDHSPSRRVSDAASDSSQVAPSLSTATDPSDPPTLDTSSSFPGSPAQLDAQSQPSLKSEEYRQLFRLPPDEVLVSDFNCALQDNFLLQGHMYLFVHYICFYSNLFGFETKKMIPFHEITYVRRAKTAAIFPTAIEIEAGGKKFFFTSFLSRDEAFKLINDLWLQYGNEAKTIAEQQDLKSELSNQENELVITESLKSFKQPVDELDSVERSNGVTVTEESNLQTSGDFNNASSSLRLQDHVEDILNTDCSTLENISVSESDAPKVPSCYAIVAESKFPITVEEFFNFFFSDDADFLASFHRKCGDKEFRCSSWYLHQKFGHARDVSFQHPIKLYLGAKFGSCQEVQKYQIYKNSHLVVETSQEINDVPYGDYFRVEGLWDVERDGDKSKECCILRVYINVAFSKKTMWKGKIVQSTVDECREAYATWIDLAHKLLKRLKKEEEAQTASSLLNCEVQHENQIISGLPLESSGEASDLRLPDTRDINDEVDNTMLRRLRNVASVASSFKYSMQKFASSLKSQIHIPLLLVLAMAMIIILMQISIVVLLSRPQQIYVIPQADWRSGIPGTGIAALLEKGINHLKSEMDMIEALLEKMHQEHTILKLQLIKLEQLQRQQF